MKITYPSFDDNLRSLGRNGWSYTTGINIRDLTPVRILLEPVNSKGQIGRGYISLPSDPATLKAIAEELLRLAEMIDPNRS